MELTEKLNSLDETLQQFAPDVANRLQAGLNRAKIDALVKGFSWTLPPDVYHLYQWHDGLSVAPDKMSFVEKLLRQKDKWHGELSGRENEIILKYGERELSAKFMPLEYALAGHRHLKLGRCVLDLLPVFILTEGKTKWYCMFRLDGQNSVLYCADGSKAPPRGIDESFLAQQIQFDCLADFVSFLTACGKQTIESQSQNQYNLKPKQFEEVFQQFATAV